MEQIFGKLESTLPPKDYPDDHWREAYTVLERYRGSPDEPVLVPESFEDSSLITYQQCRNEVQYAVVLLHKGKVSDLPMGQQLFISGYRQVFENDVFVILTKDFNSAISKSYQSAKARLGNISKRLGFMHIPKTAGTSVMKSIRRVYPAVKYVGHRSDLSNIEGYNAVCGHFYLSDLLESDGNFELILSVLRDPAERLISAIAHARRPSEDPARFGPSMRAMRELSLPAYMESRFAFHEINIYSVYLGYSPGIPKRYLDGLRENASNNVRKGNVSLLTSENLSALPQLITGQITAHWNIAHENETNNKLGFFTADEHAFIQNDLDTYVEEEREFLSSLQPFIH